MSRFLIQKIIPSLLILIIFFTTTFFAYPRKVEAQLATLDANSVPSLLQQIIQTGSAVASAANQYSIWLKEYVLDGLGLLIAKQIIRQITTSLVQWINSGFEGSPSFMQNPGAFFLDVADQITGDFLAKYGGPLTDLCSPFSIDIRLALAFKYRPNIPKRYECTLGKIISNTKNAVQGASINGFTAGDFKQGGMPAFISLTTEPQNNQYGAYLTAESELSIRVANANIEKDKELGAGRGFLSWRDPKCKAEVNTHNDQIKKNFEELESSSGSGYSAASERIRNEAIAQNFEDLENASGADYTRTSQRIGGDVTQMSRKTIQDCPIQTPGSVIESQLQNSLGGPLRELELADEINEVVNALFAQLVNTVLQKGLGAVSGSGPGDSTSYISQIQAEAQAANNTGNVVEMRASMLSSMDTYVQNTTQYKANKDASLRAVIDAQHGYEAVQACYATKIESTNPELREADKNEARERIGNIESLIVSKVAPIAAKQKSGADEAAARLKTLTDIRAAVNVAQTINDLNKPSQEYSLLAQQQRLTNAKDIVDSSQEVEDVSAQTSVMIEEAGRMMNDCELFPRVRR
jgi:hypothetical protein